jgi:hypothetical protein
MAAGLRQWEGGVYLDEPFAFGGGHSGPSCQACRRPILEGEASTRVEFRGDPDGAQGYTGEYHTACSRPFASIARFLNLDPFGGF